MPKMDLFSSQETYSIDGSLMVWVRHFHRQMTTSFLYTPTGTLSHTTLLSKRRRRSTKMKSKLRSQRHNSVYANNSDVKHGGQETYHDEKEASVSSKEKTTHTERSKSPCLIISLC